MVVKYPSMASHDFEKRYHESGPLGAVYSQQETTFRVWAPTAIQVWLMTYVDGDDGQKSEYAMERSDRGTWSRTLSGDQHGLYYTYRVLVNGMIHEAVDPYARAAGINGRRGMVVDLARTNPEGWSDLRRPPLAQAADAIVYEVHVRDMTRHSQSGVRHKGRYLGLTERGTTGPDGVSTGLSHLQELGITHVQLMPVFDFATVDERHPEAAYNWGYDPLNYNVPEGSYATDPYHGEVRIAELKQMIKALKHAGMRVIMDVVYNHTYFTQTSHLNMLVPGYYYRQDRFGHFTDGSGTGNELASERSMVRRLILDSVVYWASEYQMDGFRFDLMGLHDIFLMNEIRSTLNAVDPSIIMYGEGWAGGHSPLPGHQRALKGNVRQLPGTGAFNDDMRDGLKGHVFFAEQPGFVNGAVGMEASVQCGLVGAVDHDQVDYDQVIYTHGPWTGEAAQSINYAEAHDNLTLWDKLTKVSPDADEDVLVAMHKLCGALVLTAQGIPLLHAGQDFLRTKYGDRNSYRSSDHINALDWNRKAKYQGVSAYYRGLIALRKAHPAFRMTNVEQIRHHLRFLPVTDSEMVAFFLRDHANGDPWRRIIVAANANAQPKPLDLPHRRWTMVVNGSRAGIEPLGSVPSSRVIIPARTCLVLVDNESLSASQCFSSEVNQ